MSESNLYNFYKFYQRAFCKISLEILSCLVFFLEFIACPLLKFYQIMRWCLNLNKSRAEDYCGR
nr:MAG TPA: hypothetical protein [Inoviridae sp.]